MISFEEKQITLLKGDCLDLLLHVPDNSISLCIADLPYAVLNKSNPHAKWDIEIDMSKLWPEIWRVCKDNAAVILFAQGMFSAKLMMSESKYWRYNLVWDKINRPTGFLDAKRKPLRIHEDILVFYRSQPTYNPQFALGDVCHKRGKAGNARLSSGTNRCYGNFEQTPTVITNEKYPTDILCFEKEHKDFHHPTVKPVKLLEYLIMTYSNEGDMILDPTMGSGSTMVACVNTKRRGVGIELTEGYFKIAEQRVQHVQCQPMLF